MNSVNTSLMTDLTIVTIVEAACIKKPVMPEPVLIATASKTKIAKKRNFFIDIITISDF
jgi:hypothetical protein